MIEPDHFDEKFAGGGSGPTICYIAFMERATYCRSRDSRSDIAAYHSEGVSDSSQSSFNSEFVFIRSRAFNANESVLASTDSSFVEQSFASAVKLRLGAPCWAATTSAAAIPTLQSGASR